VSGTRKGFIKRAGADGAVAAAGELSQANASPQQPDKGRRKPPKARQVRCVVTGRDKSGKSVIVSNDLAAPVTVALLPEVHFYRLWGSDSLPALPSDGTPTLQPGYFPSKNGFRFGMFTLPPAASKRAEPVTAAALEETRRELPGLLEAMERDHPGMHTTDTIDFDVVVFGEVVMELDDGAEVHLKAGDCVIQNGTRHAWHNRSSDMCLIAFSLLGAERKW
jgi:mannose-6-phosphate isomerase-like protein (cupin superfamily)